MFYGNDFESFYIVITSSVDNEVEITSEAKNIKIRAQIKAGRDTIINLYGSNYSDFDYGTNKERIITRIAKSSGINVKTKYPVSVQTFNSWAGLKDASIAIPTNGLGDEYMLQTYFCNYVSEEHIYPPSISITAPYDGTRVELELSSYNKELKIRFSDGDSLIAGESIILELDKGDVWNIFSADGVGDLSGSKIKSTKPINVQFSFANMSQPSKLGYSDEVQSTVLPTNTWGKTYSIPTLRELNEFPAIRLFALEDDTKIYRYGVLWTTVNNSTTNEIFESKIWTDRNREEEYGIISPTIITSDKPISILLFPDYQRTKEYDYFELRNMSILTPLEQSINFASFSLFSLHEGWVQGDSARVKKLELYFELDETEEVPSDLEFSIIDVNNTILNWKSIKDYYGENYSAVELNDKHIAALEILLPDSCQYFLRSNKTKFTGYVYKTTKNHLGLKSGVIINEDFFGFQIGTFMHDLTSNDKKTPVVTLDAQNNNAKVHGLVYDNHENASKLAQLTMIENYSHNFDYKLLSADSGFITDGDENSFVVGEPVQLEFELTKKNPDADAFAIIYTSDRAGNDTLIYINKENFTSITPEQTLSEYMIVTQSEITILPKAISEGFSELSIFNLEGNKVVFSELSSMSVSLSNLQSATYIITLKSDDRLLSRKINLIR